MIKTEKNVEKRKIKFQMNFLTKTYKPEDKGMTFLECWKKKLSTLNSMYSKNIFQELKAK